MQIIFWAQKFSPQGKTARQQLLPGVMFLLDYKLILRDFSVRFFDGEEENAQ